MMIKPGPGSRTWTLNLDNDFIMDMSIFQIDDILVSSEILTEKFACDYGKCKGVCCVIGDSGAPLEEEEVDAIANNYSSFSDLMTQEERDMVSRDGFSVLDADGDRVTPIINGREECVYTCFDSNDACFCAMERAYFNGKTNFRKPISCWLYPIRVSRLSNGMLALNLHRWDICKDAFRKGEQENVRVFRFLKEPIVHRFGVDFYDALEEAYKSLGLKD